MLLKSVLYFASLASVALSATVTYDWNVGWVTANPDGLFDRQVVGINGKFPLPTVEVNKGDRVIVNMYNGLGDHNASIHFHGLYQNGTNHMDGPVMVTQCPVAPGSSITYNFTVDQNGTYWYHSHVGGQYPDGYRAPFIIHDKDAPFAGDYDEEIVISLSDWYHEVMDVLDPKFLSLYNPTGAEPVPQNILFNETLNSSVPVKANTTYLVRLINISAFASQFFWIQNHTFNVVEVDGVYTDPQEAEIIYITAAQRYSFLMTTLDVTGQNFPIVTWFDETMFDVIPEDLQLHQTNWLEYDADADHPEADLSMYETSEDIDRFDDFGLVPSDKLELFPEPDYEIEITVSMNNLDNGFNYAFFNNITYTAPKVPTLYTVISSGDLATNDVIYGEFTHTYVLNHMETVQIILNNNDPGTHPFHLHGHAFQVIQRSDDFPDDSPTPYDPNNHTDFPAIPMRRDTVYVKPNGYMVLRFIADNPGVWLFHCHIEWHLEQGLAITLVEAPTQLQSLDIPDQHFEVCANASLPTTGNAAANTEDYTDLSGQNAQVADLPSGFTARGIVALVFSCIAAFLGMAAIAWYGVSDLPSTTTKLIVEIEEDAGLEPDVLGPNDVTISRE